MGGGGMTAWQHCASRSYLDGFRHVFVGLTLGSLLGFGLLGVSVLGVAVGFLLLGATSVGVAVGAVRLLGGAVGHLLVVVVHAVTVGIAVFDFGVVLLGFLDGRGLRCVGDLRHDGVVGLGRFGSDGFFDRNDGLLLGSGAVMENKKK